jgi:hypothetical protein
MPRHANSLKINEASVGRTQVGVLISVRSVVQLLPGPLTDAASTQLLRGVRFVELTCLTFSEA